jgi:hypothetical protein
MGDGVLVVILKDNNRVDILIFVCAQILVFALRRRSARMMMMVVMVVTPMHKVRLLGVIVVRLEMRGMCRLLASREDVIVWRMFVSLRGGSR